MMPRTQRRTRRLLHGAEGVSAVEFAIALPVLLLIICGIMDFGNIYYQAHQVNEAAREGARRLAVDPTQNVTSFITTHYGGQLVVNVSPTTPVSNNDVTVTVTRSVPIINPLISVFFPSNPYPVEGKTVMRVE